MKEDLQNSRKKAQRGMKPQCKNYQAFLADQAKILALFGDRCEITEKSLTK